VPVSGTTAVVFKADVQGRAQALRFFTREDAASRPRYTALNTWFTERGLTADVAVSRWIDDAILVDGRRWPMIQMEWVAGRTLDQHVDELVEAGDRTALQALAGTWRDLVRRAQAARFAHGDLQHGNVLVDPAGRLRLVDFDSAWIVPFAGGPPPREGGHRNYQPPNRVWGPWMDTFPGLVIYLSLLALAREPRQWEQLYDGENLLFRREDYQQPHGTRAWTWVERLHDPQVDQLAARLRACCAPGWTATGDLESLLTGPVPWWTRTGTVPRAAGVQPAASAVPAGPVAPAGRDGPAAAAGAGARSDSAAPGSPGGPRPVPAPRPRPRGPAPEPTGPTPRPPGTWWQQAAATSATPAGPPAPGRLERTALRTAGRWIRASLAAALVFTLLLGAISSGLDRLPGWTSAQAAGTAALIALLPSVGLLLLIGRRRRPKPPRGGR
jgi:hypothetical protein